MAQWPLIQRIYELPLAEAILLAGVDEIEQLCRDHHGRETYVVLHSIDLNRPHHSDISVIFNEPNGVNGK